MANVNNKADAGNTPTAFLKGAWSIFLYQNGRELDTIDKEAFEYWLLESDYLRLPMTFFDGSERVHTYSTSTVKEFWQTFHPAKQLRIITAFYHSLKPQSK